MLPPPLPPLPVKKPKVMAADDFQCYRDMKEWNAAGWRLRERGVSVMTCGSGKRFVDMIAEEMVAERLRKASLPKPLPPLPRALVIDEMLKALPLPPPPLPPLPGVPK